MSECPICGAPVALHDQLLVGMICNVRVPILRVSVHLVWRPVKKMFRRLGL